MNVPSSRVTRALLASILCLGAAFPLAATAQSGQVSITVSSGDSYDRRAGGNTIIIVGDDGYQGGYYPGDYYDRDNPNGVYQGTYYPNVNNPSESYPYGAYHPGRGSERNAFPPPGNPNLMDPPPAQAAPPAEQRAPSGIREVR